MESEAFFLFVIWQENLTTAFDANYPDIARNTNASIKRASVQKRLGRIESSKRVNIDFDPFEQLVGHSVIIYVDELEPLRESLLLKGLPYPIAVFSTEEEANQLRDEIVQKGSYKKWAPCKNKVKYLKCEVMPVLISKM